VTRAGALEELIGRRTEMGAAFFADGAAHIAGLCLQMAERFVAGGRLLAVAETPQGWSDARHVAVEFVHPVIVGKRALPALALGADDVEPLARPGDMILGFDVEPDGPDGCLRVVLDPPAGDPFVRQELVETAYHLLWELVHVFLEHLEGSSAGAGASAFLYPFLERGGRDLEPVVADVRASVLAKADEVRRLREETLRGAGPALRDAAVAIRRSLEAGGHVLAFGNGGSATDAMDLVADLRAAPQGWPARAAIDLTADTAVLTALANDVGTEVLFQRQVIAYGRPGDAAIAFSTSGGSANVVRALVEARRRGLVTIAFVGYGGGRILDERLADHVVATPSEYVPRIQEAQASAYHVLRELVEHGA
jgi:D-sedoheptulose 7-phosphate isomerase